MSDMRTLMTQVSLESASNSLWCAFIYMRARTDLTPEERAALEAAKAAADVFSGMVYDRIVSPAAGQAEDAA